ncbi:MAG: hypothetical protein K9K67_12405 [Bacteriovoracaceae bacterium]|nr:hypothetical protein [Bacteriovoracaceae bacterium]
MSTKTLGIIALFALSAPLLAQTRKSPYDRGTTKKSVKTVTKQEEKGEDLWELNLGIGAQTFEVDGDSDNSSSNRIEVNMGRMFRLSENITTTTLVNASLTSIGQSDLDKANADDSNIGINIDSSRFTDIGLAQKFSYEINSNLGKFKPFIQGHYSTGTWTTNITATGLSGEVDMKMDYKRYGATAGVELVLAGGIVPFVKYTIDEYDFDRSGKLEGKLGGIAVNETIETEDGKASSNTISVGLGVTF